MTSPDLEPLVGCEITQITLDYRVTLLLVSDDGGASPSVDAWLALEAPFDLDSDGETVTVRPDIYGNYDRIPRLLGLHVVEALVAGDRSLDLAFSDGTLLHSARTPHFESWQLGGRGVQEWIALPTGP
jgi:hypothetical protein